MQSNQKRKGIILIHGSPGSGKTTFSKYLLNISPQKTLLINTDDLQMYFHSHSTLNIPTQQILISCHLSQLVAIPKITIKQFSPDIWKKSRDFVRIQIQKFVKISNILIIQDDFLLKSSRKSFKHFAALNEYFYIQIYMDTTLQQCLNLNSKRQQKVPEFILKQKFQKIEATQLKLSMSQRNISWSWIQQHFKVPQNFVIQPVISTVKESKSIIQQTQLQIRKYITQVITTDLNMTLFPKLSIKQIGKTLSQLKKTYNVKKGFLQFKLQVMKISQYLNKSSS